MLSKIREKATGVFAWVIVILITIPFALWGINSYFEGGGQAVVASVEGFDIDLNTYQNALSERRRVMAQVLQQAQDAEFFESQTFKNQVLEGLIQNAAEASYAQKQGYRVSDEMLGAAIKQLPYFQVDGQFESERYQSLVANAGMSIARFEQQQRQQMISDQIKSAYSASAFVSESDLNQVLTLLDQSRTADYAVLSVNDPSLEVVVDEELISKHYEDNKDDYFAPEQMRVSYLSLSVEKIAANLDVSEDELRKFYDNNTGRFGQPEQRRVSHILVSLAADADEAAEAEAREKANTLRDQAMSGADFSELAKANSDDSGSAINGGDLGVINRGSMVKPFEDAAFALSGQGAVSDVVRSRFGFHVIKLTEYKPADVKPFDSAKEEIESEIKNQLAEDQYLENAETFSTLVYEQPESLVPAADELQLEIMESDWFSLDEGDSIASNRKFRTMAFSTEVRIEGLNSEAFEIDANTMIAVRKLETRERRQLALDEVAGKIRKDLQREARSKAVIARGEALIESLKASQDWEALVQENNLLASVFEGKRDDAFDQVGRELVREIFDLPLLSEGQPKAGGFSSSSGDYVIYQLTAIDDADPAKVDEARREAVRNVLRARQGDDLYQGYQEALRAASDVKVFQEQL